VGAGFYFVHFQTARAGMGDALARPTPDIPASDHLSHGANHPLALGLAVFPDEMVGPWFGE